MKRFKKVLALVLAGVLALAMLTACAEVDPDKVMPEDGTPEVMMALERAADTNKVSQPGDYSVKYSAVTKQLLENLIRYKNNEINETTYKANYDKITAGLKIVGGLTDNTIQPNLNTGNPAIKFNQTGSKANYDTLFTSQYGLSDKVGIAFVSTTNSFGVTTTYQLVCLFDVN